MDPAADTAWRCTAHYGGKSKDTMPLARTHGAYTRPHAVGVAAAARVPARLRRTAHTNPVHKAPSPQRHGSAPSTSDAHMFAQPSETELRTVAAAGHSRPRSRRKLAGDRPAWRAVQVQYPSNLLLLELTAHAGHRHAPRVKAVYAARMQVRSSHHTQFTCELYSVDTPLHMLHTCACRTSCKPQKPSTPSQQCIELTQARNTLTHTQSPHAQTARAGGPAAWPAQATAVRPPHGTHCHTPARCSVTARGYPPPRPRRRWPPPLR